MVLLALLVKIINVSLYRTTRAFLSDISSTTLPLYAIYATRHIRLINLNIYIYIYITSLLHVFILKIHKKNCPWLFAFLLHRNTLFLYLVIYTYFVLLYNEVIAHHIGTFFHPMIMRPFRDNEANWYLMMHVLFPVLCLFLFEHVHSVVHGIRQLRMIVNERAHEKYKRVFDIVDARFTYSLNTANITLTTLYLGIYLVCKI